MLKNSKGITLIALVITVIVLIILASIATYSGLKTVGFSKYYEAVSELKIIQAKVNEIYEENKSNEETGHVKKEYGEKITSSEKISKASKAYNSVSANNKTGEDIGIIEDYVYFSEKYIKDTLDIEGIQYDFIVNLNTRTVMLIDGFTKDEETYYALCQIEGEQYNVEYSKLEPIYFTVMPENKSINMLQGNTKFSLSLKNYVKDNINKEKITYKIGIKETDKFKIVDLGTRTMEGGNAKDEKITLEITSVPHVTLSDKENLTIITDIIAPYEKQIKTTVTVQMPTIAKGYISDFRGVEYEDKTENEDIEKFETLYGDNNGEFEYAGDGSIVLDENNEIPVFDRTLRNYEQGYSIYTTIKGDINQWPVPAIGTDSSGNNVYDSWGPATILGMTTENTSNSNRLCWFGFRNGYFQIYSYSNNTFNNVNEEKIDVNGFRSLKMDSKYNNKKLSIQITGESGGKTRVYFNGTLFTEFESGDGNGTFNNATIGDLRPLRGLKFKGNLYDINIYNRILTSDEIKQNWEYAKNTWEITE